MTLPVATSKAANKVAVPLRLVVNHPLKLPRTQRKDRSAPIQRL